MAEVGGGQPWEQLKLTRKKHGNAPYEIGLYGGTAVAHGSLAYFSLSGLCGVFGYNPEKDDWSELPECPQSLFRLAVINNILTAVGGRDYKFECTNCLSSFSSGEWVTVFPPMPTKRYWLAVTSAQNYLIAAGGYGVRGYLSTVEVMDMNTLEWYTAASLPERVSSLTATVCGGRLYLLGGYGLMGNKTNAVFTCTLDSLICSCHPPSQTPPEASVWQRVADVPVPLSTCITLNGRVMAVGGMDSQGYLTPAVHMYNADSDSWFVLGNMPTGRCECVVAEMQDYIMAVGGSRGNCTIEVGYLQLSGLDLESVDGTTVLDEDDLHDVRSAVADLSRRWQDLGVSLGIRQDNLKAIISDNPYSSSDYYLRKVLTLWLRQNYKVERFGEPTWRRLVVAVKDHNLALARTIAREHHGKLEPASKSKRLFNEAMKEGHVRSRNTVTVFIGAAGTGKTCSKHVLMNEKPPEVRVSTPVAERPVKVMKILTTDSLKWCRLSPADQKEILAKFMVNSVVTGEASDKVIPTTIADKAKAMKSSSEALHRNSTQSSEAPYGEPLSSKQAKEIPPSMLKDDSTTIAESARIKQVKALLESSTSEAEFARLIELLSGTEAPLEVSLIYLTDSGGQPQFHEVLPIFLRRTSVYIFVMKLSESLDKQPLIEYFDDNGNDICKPYTAAHTNMQILRHCICTMQSHKFRKAAGEAPNLLFIGTHKDQEHLCPETREVKNQKLVEMLLPEFQDEVVYSNLANRELIFPLNAKSPGEKEHEVAEEIRKLIMSVCTAEPDEIPLRWYCLELKLQEIAQALERGVMSKEECFAVACTLHFDTESFEAALQYLDELNIIFYYPDILPNTVFTDSQVLITKASELVKFSHKFRNKDAGSLGMACGGECRKFQDYALVTVGFLKSKSFELNEHYVDDIFTPDDLVKLFRALLVFADFSDTEYFMPCLLQIISSEEVAKHQVSSSAATVPLVLYFPKGVPPWGYSAR